MDKQVKQKKYTDNVMTPAEYLKKKKAHKIEVARRKRRNKQ
jgi:hypothetical protein